MFVLYYIATDNDDNSRNYNFLYCGHRETSTPWHIQMNKLHGFVPNFFRFYDLLATVKSRTHGPWPASTAANV